MRLIERDDPVNPLPPSFSLPPPTCGNPSSRLHKAHELPLYVDVFSEIFLSMEK
jgi:hypothetical protein